MTKRSIKVAAGTPRIKIADPSFNARELISLSSRAERDGVSVLVFPELCLTGATCGDLFFNETLLDGAKAGLQAYLDATKGTSVITVIGLPLRENGRTYNCAAVCCGGRVLKYIFKRPTISERRWFDENPDTTMSLSFGEWSLGVVIGPIQDTVPEADLICNPVYEPELVGAASRRVRCIEKTNVTCISSYAGMGESTTDSVCGGHKLIAQGGKVVAEARPFIGDDLLIHEITPTKAAVLSCECSESIPHAVDPHPFFPSDPDALALHCEEILTIQSAGLAARMERAYAKKLIVGISGGLDSTLALLVMVRATDLLHRPRTDVIAVTMPCFGTTVRTKTNATVLCEKLGVDFRCVDIFDAVNQHFKDIGHDPSVRDVTYENSQARERTQVLMDIANDCGGMVVGTGDLSELALGWATYNGDHMSMYGVNANLPKTLIRHVVAHCAADYRKSGDAMIADALCDILDTPVSPELLPADADGSIAQKTEDLVGPYELHDFYLYYMLRYGYGPKKLYAMAQEALGAHYDDETLKKWLHTFLRRFFSQQFKRSCLPDGPQVFPISLSPRGAWIMPSDASSALWLAEADSL